MNNSRPSLNGSDYLMLGFDREMRRAGYAGNTCMIVIELNRPISKITLRERLDSLAQRYPVICSRPAGLLFPFFPSWKTLRHIPQTIPIREHQEDTGLEQKLFNEPLDIQAGNLMRFDLIQTAAGGMKILFLWTHALMDASSAEYFLALINDTSLPHPPHTSNQPSSPRRSLKLRIQLAWKNLHHIDRLNQHPPLTLGERFPENSRQTRYLSFEFTSEESDRIHQNAQNLCGVLGSSQYRSAACLMELHRMQVQLGRSSPGYVLPIPVSLRKKGSVEPLFSNQVGMLMTQLLPHHLEQMKDAVDSLKSQTHHALREGLLESSILLPDLFKFLPLSIFMAFVKNGLNGEICSLFFGDTGAVRNSLGHFLGQETLSFTHVAPVTPSPGLGVVFFVFLGRLRMTVSYLTTVLQETEALHFAKSLQRRLLES